MCLYKGSKGVGHGEGKVNSLNSYPISFLTCNATYSLRDRQITGSTCAQPSTIGISVRVCAQNTFSMHDTKRSRASSRNSCRWSAAGSAGGAGLWRISTLLPLPTSHGLSTVETLGWSWATHSHMNGYYSAFRIIVWVSRRKRLGVHAQVSRIPDTDRRRLGQGPDHGVGRSLFTS
jgi:hypothetical protein